MDNEIKTSEAFSLVKEWDLEKGESWSNDSFAIAEIMGLYAQKKLDEILRIILKNTKNRKKYKNWEEQIICLCGGYDGICS